MTRRRLFLAIAATLPLVACTSLRPLSEGLSESRQYECKKGRPCEASVIDTYLEGNTWTGQLDRDPLYLARDNPNVDIVWKLPPDSDYGFCTSDDGVSLKTPDRSNQFEKMSPVGAASGPKGQCKDQYHWTAKNTEPGQTYQYRIQFRDSQRVYVIDPWIVNGK